jgi:hypothetical protein
MFKKLSTMIFFGLLTLSAARAQSSPPTQALVPFAFHVQSRVYPAGTYRLTFDLKTNVLSLRGADQISQSGFFLVTPAEESHRTKEGAGLVFKCYDKSCYLAQVWQSAGSGEAGLELPGRQSERHTSFLTRTVSFAIPAK